MKSAENSRTESLATPPYGCANKPSETRFSVLLDYEHYKFKPENFGAITNRLKHAMPTELTDFEFIEAVRNGCTWVPAYLNTWGNGGDEMAACLCALDFDNDIDSGKGEDRHQIKRQLVRGEEGFVDATDVLERLNGLGLHSLCWYETLGCREKCDGIDSIRFRVVIDLEGVVTSKQEYKSLMLSLLKRFPEADQCCSNPNRPFLGSNGLVYPLQNRTEWRSVTNLTVLRELTEGDKAEDAVEHGQRAPSISGHSQYRNTELTAMLADFNLLEYVEQQTGKVPYRTDEKYAYFHDCPVCGHHDCFRIILNPTGADCQLFACYSSSNPMPRGYGNALSYFQHVEHLGKEDSIQKLCELTGHICGSGEVALPELSDQDRVFQVFKDKGLGATAASLSDMQLSKTFTDVMRDRLAYISERDRWFAYDGICWRESAAKQLAELMMKDFISAAIKYCIEPGNRVVEDSAKRLGAYNSFAKRKNLLEDSASELLQTIESFDANPSLLNVKNGTIDLTDTIEFREHNPADRLTHYAPVDYDSSATCDLFVDVLNVAMEGDVELISYMKKLFGKIVAGDASDDGFYLFGEQPRTSKGTIIGPLATMLGRGKYGYCRSVQPETFARKAFVDSSKPSGDIARLQGSRLVVTSEAQQGMLLNESLVKQLTGADYITARFQYGQDFSFQFDGVIVMLANSFPMVSDRSLFESGRVRVVPFNHVIPFEERDASLRKKLQLPSELSGLLNWCLEGIREYRSEGFAPCDAVIRATAEYEGRADGIGLFMRDCFDDDPTTILRVRDAHTAYREWASANHYEAVGAREFNERLRKHPSWRDRSLIGGKRIRNVLIGIRLKE